MRRIAAPGPGSLRLALVVAALALLGRSGAAEEPQTPTHRGPPPAHRPTAVAVFADGSVGVAGDVARRPASSGASGGAGAFLARCDEDGTLRWVRRARGTGEARSLSVAAGPDGASLLTGWFDGRVGFEGGERMDVPLAAGGRVDAFVARYDAGGSLEWVAHAGGEADGFHYAVGMRVGTCADGSCVVGGPFAGTVTFGAGGATEHRLTALGEVSTFVGRLHPDGTWAWVARVACDFDAERGCGLVPTADGGCALVGHCRGEGVLASGGGPPPPTVASRRVEIHLARLGPGGARGWVRRIGSTVACGPAAVACGRDGAVVLTGWFLGTATFGAGGAPPASVSASGGMDMFVARYRSGGDLDWVRRSGGTGEDCREGRHVAALEDGSCVVAGRAEEEGKAPEVVVWRYAPCGRLAWTRRPLLSPRPPRLPLPEADEASLLTSGWFLLESALVADLAHGLSE